MCFIEERSGRHAKDGTSVKRWIESRPVSGGEGHMKSIVLPEFELEVGIEELEPKVAPDGGETVVPLPGCGHHKG